jgi:hypothetical protein
MGFALLIGAILQLTASITLATASLAASIFLNSILGLFGFAATTVESLNNLRASQQVLEKVKQRHTRKKTRVTKRLVKRSGKRVAGTALAATAMGTIGVAVAMTGLEIHDYCEDRRELQDDANLLYSTKIGFDEEQCLEESLNDAELILSSATEEVQSSVSEAYESTSDYSAEKWASVKSKTSQAVQSSKRSARRIWHKAKSFFND